MKFKKIKINKSFVFISFISTSFILLNFQLASGADIIKFTPQITIPGSNSITANSPIGVKSADGYLESNLLSNYIKSIYDYGIIIAGILAAVVMMGGGVLWLTSGGSQNRISQAKDLIFGSVIGLGLILSSWIILNTINPNLLNLKNLKIKEAEKIGTYCSPIKGLVYDEKSPACTDGATGVPGPLTTNPICKEGESCIKTEFFCYDFDETVKMQVNRYMCLDSSKYICCEYAGNFFNARVCKTYESNCPAEYILAGNPRPLTNSWSGKVCNIPKGASNDTPCYSP